MTVQNTIVKNLYAGNGSTKAFPYTFALNEEDGEFVQVFVTDEDGNETEVNDFSVDTDNRIVTYPAIGENALADGCKIAILRVIPNIQELKLENQGPFFARDIEAEFDRVVMMVQQVKETTDRCIKAGPTSELTIDAVVIEELYRGRDEAVASAAAAKDSEDAAALSASHAADSAAAALISETNAKTSETNAELAKDSAEASALTASGNANASIDAMHVAANSAQEAKDSATLANTAADGSKHWAQLAHDYTEPLRHALGNMFEYDADADVQLVADPLIGTDPKWELDADNDLMPV